MGTLTRKLAELIESDGDVVSSALDNVVSGAGYYYNNAGTVVGNSSTGKNSLIRVNNKTIADDITIGATENASTTGPITVASGKTLTVTSGGRFVAL